MKQFKYIMALVLSVIVIVAPIAAIAIGISLYMKYDEIWMLGASIGVAVIFFFLNGLVRELRVNAREQSETDEYGEKKLSQYKYLSKEEKEQVDLVKTATRENIISSSALKKMIKEGPKEPEKRINELIGLQPVKDSVEEMVARMKFESEENKKIKKSERRPLSIHHMVFFGNPGTGKAQPLYSKVLTPNGFVKMGDIKIGDTVLAYDGKPSKVLGVFPQGIKKIYEIVLSDGSKCRCSDEHLWQVQNYADRRENTYRIIQTKDMLGNIYCKNGHGNLNYTVPIAKNVNTSGKLEYKFIVSINYVGEEECQCIYIDHPDHLYVTDDYIVTHNTTIARIMTSFLYQYGYIKENKCIEIDGNFLKAGTDSATKTELVIREAFGGVLFIDEAYALMDSSDASGEQVIATLIKQMEDNRDKFILILAGYTNEMKKLIAANPGFESRIKDYLYFPDYNEVEMREILRFMANKQNFFVDESAYSVFDVVVGKERRLKSFGNARTVRNILDKAIDKHSLNLMKNVIGQEDRYRLVAADFQGLKLGGISSGMEGLR